ncbi:glycosyltransferase [Lysinibacillus sphaericus]|uniref:4,4'-diaponeurosporenoate glycosyltransferase n=3 Tax=Lysinibacillus TaxID=400634 RepID=A0A2S0K0W0_LYSSH|nr:MULTISPECIES: glycosyltransferase [Lysinibacillus]AHN21849.1 glycosyl transferase family 2 [Lysinibacillus varians]AVK96971.1 glycosyl transferase family 2 [Lysinibacillus sphaericus]MED4542246.1 glycosyltransferase [Lysinibacillus sphaericus]TKI20464.1 glycosyltransferase [Lysinibacillus sphaericus]TKI47344.1 glycosyltransferase [Lysinibacillus tabacifolii]
MDTSTNTHQEDVIISIIIPAHNEEKYIGKCLESISKASKLLQNQVEIIVVLNRCTDKTEEIAKSYNCITVNNDDKNLSKIRNTGVERARGEIIVTIDADTQMNEHMLTKVVQNLSSGKYIGGGVTGKFERMSLGIFVSTMLLIGPLLFKYGAISVGIFWCYKEDFKSINGFNEAMLMAEDADFAKRLKVWGKKKGKKYGTIQNGMITSSRKFDKHGDWVLLKRPKLILAYLKGTDKQYADEAYYENHDR